MKNLQRTIAKLMIGLLILGASAFGAEEYSFTVKNSTDTTITEVLVSEDGKTWNFFDIGKEGIVPNQTMKLVWNASTNGQDCKQQLNSTHKCNPT